MSHNDWKQIALYLASCHAATYEGERGKKSASKYQVARLRGICEAALQMIERGFMERPPDEAWVKERLRDALTPCP